MDARESLTRKSAPLANGLHADESQAAMSLETSP